MEKIQKLSIFTKPTPIWPVFFIGILLFLSWLNRFPEGYVFAGADAFQITNLVWLKENANFLWSNWLGEGGFSIGYFYYPFYSALISISQWLNLTPSQQSILYFLFYWVGAYLSLLISLLFNTPWKCDPLSLKANIFAILYALNPYTYYFFYEIWGFTSFYFLYVIFPVLFMASAAFFYDKSINQRLKSLLIIALMFFLATIGFGNFSFFLSVNIVLISYFFIANFLTRPRVNNEFLKKLFLFLWIEFLATCWAIVPQIQFWLTQSGPIVKNQIHNFQEWIIWQRLHLFDLLTLNPYAISSSLTTHWTYIFGGAFFLLLLFGLVKEKKAHSLNPNLITTTFICVLILLIESKGRGIAIPDLSVFLFSNPLLGAFRSYGRFYIFLPFFLIFSLMQITKNF